VNDALSARAAGCTFLAVPYGYNEGNSVHSLDVDAIVESIEHAARWVAAR
jgi:phosphoglycolate phosphatase